MGNQFVTNLVANAGRTLHSAGQFVREKLQFLNPSGPDEMDLPHTVVDSVIVGHAGDDDLFPLRVPMLSRLFVHKLKRNKGEITNEDAHFLSDSFTNLAGTLQYRLFVPSCYHGQALPLIVMLHGCKQDAETFSVGTRMNHVAERAGCFVLYPQQVRFANTGKCWTWYKSINQMRDSGEPSIIAGMTKKIIKSHSIDAKKVYIGGLSSGASMAYIVGLAYPEIYAAIGVHSGLLYRGVRNLFAALATMKQGATVASWPELPGMPAVSTTPLIVFHGDNDTVVNPKNAAELIGYHQNGRKFQEVTQKKSVAGHDCTRTLYKQADGTVFLEKWMIHGAGHAWSGGDAAGSYTDEQGPNASEEMLRFFMSRNND